MNKKILYLENQFGSRGTTISTFDYANFNETLLGNISYIAAPENSDMFSLLRFKERFGERAFTYTSLEHLQTITDSLNIDVAYWIKSGIPDGIKLKNVKNVLHAVFNIKNPEITAYVSEWLALENPGFDYIPHIVHLPPVIDNYRKHLGISEDTFVIGRHGGYDQFDIPYVPEVLRQFLDNNPKALILLMNTKPLPFTHERLLYVKPTYEREEIAGFINTCDVMLHARSEGESFGLSIAEFLHQGKPVITTLNTRDKNQAVMLKEHGYYYDSPNELYAILSNFKRKDFNYTSLVEEFLPENVMNQFDKIFLQ